jgi:RNA polymerase sigma-70 factor (ECF subfamily)
VDAEDVLQDTFCKAFETIQRFRWQGEGSFYAWIAAISEHVILNATKKRQLRALQLDRDLPESGTTPGQRLSREERYERLKASVRALTPDQRQAVMLARIDGLPTKEIASRMNRSEEAVRQLLTRALRELKRTFGDTESLHLPDRSLAEEGLGDG